MLNGNKQSLAYFTSMGCAAMMIAQPCSAKSGSDPGQSNLSISPQVETRFRQSMSDAWFTGSLLSSNPSGPAPGHAVVEPYFYTLVSDRHFDGRGNLKKAPRSVDFRSDLPIMYGVADGFWMGLVGRTGLNSSKGPLSGSELQFGDTTVRLQYRMLKRAEGGPGATVSIGFDLTVPTGRYQNLKPQSRDTISSGVWTNTVALRADYVLWLPNGRVLRPRLNISRSFPIKTNVHGNSAFDTNDEFVGSVTPGKGSSLGLSLEYSASKKVALCGDLILSRQSAPMYKNTSGIGLDQWRGIRSSASSVAPAVQYNWNDRVGLIAGVQIQLWGRNTNATISSIIALNMLI